MKQTAWIGYIVFAALGAIACTFNAAAQVPPAATPQLPARANPASENCIKQGGKLELEKNGKGDQFGVCVFDDNLQCEEWALLRGECPAGGLEVTSYATLAARYCAITGGSYTAGAGRRGTEEEGTCAFANGRRCIASEYFNGRCARLSEAPTEPARSDASGARSDKTIHAVFACASGKTVTADFVQSEPARVDLVLSDGRTFSLPQVKSGSGARYANANETIVFWNKGDTAVIQEKGRPTYTACTTK